MLKANGIDVISTAQFGNKAYGFQQVVVRYINERKEDSYAYTVIVNIGHLPEALKAEQKTSYFDS
jgi:hypothetical protein